MNSKALAMAGAALLLAAPLFGLAPRPPEELAQLAAQAQAFVEEGDKAMAEDQYREARSCYQKAERADPKNKYAWVGLGNAWYYLKNTRMARQCYVKAYRLDRSDRALKKMIADLSY